MQDVNIRNTPEMLKALGLDREEIVTAGMYLLARDDIAFRQRNIVIVFALSLCAWLMLRHLLIAPVDQVIVSAAAVIAPWLPGLSFVFAGMCLYVQRKCIAILDAGLNESGLSREAVAGVKAIGQDLSFTKIWRPLLGSYLFDRMFLKQPQKSN